MKKVLAAAILLMVVLCSIPAQTAVAAKWYWVSECIGNDVNRGTEASPLKSFWLAAKRAVPGDRIVVMVCK